MSTAFKAQAMARRFKQQVALVVSGLTLTESFDSSNYPIEKVVKGAEIVWVKIESRGNAGRVDGLGLPQRAYSPHKVIILRSSTATDVAVREACMAEAVRLGTLVEIWEAATVPAYDLSSAVLVASMPNDPVHGLTNAQ